MFNPTRDQVRLFFLQAWQKHLRNETPTPAETLALHWIKHHPEYFSLLDTAVEDALAKDYATETGEHNPFLHLSMHLAIAEQLSIDQPPGIRQAFAVLCAKYGNEHDAAHDVMECLGEQIYQQQRNGVAFDSQKYLDSIHAYALKQA